MAMSGNLPEMSRRLIKISFDEGQRHQTCDCSGFCEAATSLSVGIDVAQWAHAVAALPLDEAPALLWYCLHPIPFHELLASGLSEKRKKIEFLGISVRYDCSKRR
jgi:hypothetical protein